MMDLTNIRQIAGGDESFIKGVLEVFLTKEKEYSEGIHRELENKNYPELRQVVHKMKSSISVLGMTDFKKKLNELELGIEKGSLTEEQISSGSKAAHADFLVALQAVRDMLKTMS